MKKKVLLLITKANWGGAQRYAYDLAASAPKDEFYFSVAFGQPGHLAEELVKRGIDLHEVPALRRDVSLLGDIRVFFELRRLLKSERPRILHLNSSKAAGLGALAGRLCATPGIVFTVHGWPFLEQRPAWARALIWLFSWLTALLSHRVIVVSDHDLAIARRMPFIGKKTVRIYNGIRPLSAGDGTAIRSAFPTGVTITGTIGELTANKNHEALIEQARANPELHVAIVGEGELRPALEEKIKHYRLQDRVKLFGFMPAQEALPGFDRFVLPSKKEGLPYVLLEARMAGLPIEANRVGGVGEALDNDLREFALERMLEKTFALYRSL